MIYDGRHLEHEGIKVRYLWDESIRQQLFLPIDKEECPAGNQWVCKFENDMWGVYVFNVTMSGFTHGMLTEEEIRAWGWGALIDNVEPSYDFKFGGVIDIPDEKQCTCEITLIMNSGCPSARGQECQSKKKM